MCTLPNINAVIIYTATLQVVDGPKLEKNIYRRFAKYCEENLHVDAG